MVATCDICCASQSLQNSRGFELQACSQSLPTLLQDPLNQRFVLLSDTDVPIYPARVIYAQLMSEQLSRIAACQVGLPCTPHVHSEASHHKLGPLGWISHLGLRLSPKP